MVKTPHTSLDHEATYLHVVHTHSPPQLVLPAQDIGIDPDHKDPTTRIYLTRVAQPYHVDSTDVVGESMCTYYNTCALITMPSACFPFALEY